MSVELRRWWSRRWLAVLDEAGPAQARRVQQGQALVRRGAVEDLDVTSGRITGTVIEERAPRVEVVLAWPPPDPSAWDAAIERLADELRFTAALLEGALPEGIDEVLEESGVVLFPRLDDIDRRCPCDEEADPCRHAVAVHTAVASRFDRDPFLLLELRGRGRQRLLDALRGRRAGADALSDASDLDLAGGRFRARGDLEAIDLHPAPVVDPAGLLAHLGPPPGVDDPSGLVELVERAAATAWRLAAGDGSRAADDELLVTELRAQRVGTVASLAAALGRDDEAVRRDLDRLFEAGAVMRTGVGERARYRAAVSAPPGA